MICILTGASDEQINRIREQPGIDLCLAKSTSAKLLAAKCKQELSLKRSKQRAEQRVEQRVLERQGATH